MTGTLIELILAGLLIATCLWCFVLNRRLAALKAGQADLKAAIAAFDEATQRAESNLARMEADSLGVRRDLGGLMKRAGVLVDELAVMVSAGDHIAGRIEGAVNDVRLLGGRRAETPQ